MCQPEDSGGEHASSTVTPRSRSESLDAASDVQQQDRKRPRLEIGDSLSADEALSESAVAPEAMPSGQKQSVVKQTRLSPTNNQSLRSPTNSPRKPPSMVTINTRPSSSSEDHAGQSGLSSATSPDVPFDAGAAKAEALPGPEPGASPAPSQSPVIEIADPEDIDEEDVLTKWTPIAQLTSMSAATPLDHTYVYLTFPLARSVPIHETDQIVHKIASNLRVDTHIRLSDPLATVLDWIEDFLQRCLSLSRPILERDITFWTEIPCIVDGLLRRKTELPPYLDIKLLERFHVQFAGLAARFIDYDTKSILQNIGEAAIPELLSQPYLSAVATTLATYKVPLYELLHIQGLNVGEFVFSISMRLVDGPCNIIQRLYILVENIAGELQKKPGLGLVFLDCLRLVHHVVKSAHEFHTTRTEGSTSERLTAILAEIYRQSFEFYRFYEAVVMTSITKQWAWLTIERSYEIYGLLGNTLFSLASHDPEIATYALEDDVEDESEISLEDLAEIALHHWRFTHCWKAVTSGRMELRVQGMDLLQSDFVSVYQNYIRYRDLTDHPLIQHIVRCIRTNQVLPYLVSAATHSQVIVRSNNVIAFLAVSKTLTSDDIDLLWDFIIENRDPRTVTEIFGAIHTLIVTMDPPYLGHLFGKLFELPAERLEPKILDLYNVIFSMTQERPFLKKYIPDVLQTQLVVKILRDESCDCPLGLENRVVVQRWGQEKLTELLKTVCSEPALLTIWEECIADLKQLESRRCGSLRAISAFAKSPEAMDILTGQFDYPSVLLNELCETIQTLPGHFSDNNFLRNDFVLRIHALVDIILAAAQDLTEEHANMLWLYIFVSDTIGQAASDFAWDRLSAVVAYCKNPNVFIDLFAAKLLPRLGPGKYGPSSLRFVKALIEYQIRTMDENASTEDIFELSGSEVMWQMILSSHPDTVEMEAINMLIWVYLDSPAILGCPKYVAEAVHAALVDRCIDQIIRAAASLISLGDAQPKHSGYMQVVSEDTEKSHELRFSRSLLFLRHFMSALKLRPRYSPPPAMAPIEMPKSEIKGDEIVIKYQVFDGKKQTTILDVHIGDLNTAHQLALLLRERHAIQSCKGVFRAQKMNLFDNHATLRHLYFGPNTGLLILTEIARLENNSAGKRRNSSTHVDSLISDNFDQLYELLDLESHLAAEIFNFLQVFPVQTKAQMLLRHSETPFSQVLPLSKPYKLLYAANALYSALEDESLSLKPNTEFIERSLAGLQAVCKEHLPALANDHVQGLVTANLIDCVLMALRVPVSKDISLKYTLPNNGLLQFCLKTLEIAQFPPYSTIYGPATRPLECQTFSVILEACMHDASLWTQFVDQGDPSSIFSRVLLNAPAPIRTGIADSIFALTGIPSAKPDDKMSKLSSATSRYSEARVKACLGEIWLYIPPLLPKTLENHLSARQFYDIAIAIVQSLGDSIDNHGIMHECARLMEKHQPQQVIGQENNDHVIFGLVRILIHTVTNIRASGNRVEENPLLNILLTKYLFPPLSDGDLETELKVRLPILKSSLRQDLYELVLLLGVDEDDSNTILDWAAELMALDHWEPQITNDRFGLRSEAGHSGLRNLSNTCYLNSLLTQLYMNLEFRKLFFNLSRPNDLAFELCKVFANMQSSAAKSVNPIRAVEAIRTYDNEPIDVSIQMDVDEFFNLIFDRLESEMPSPEAKVKFRSIYGGQLVQQIKSKECEHISERLEPFSAIQCEIRGKHDLEESLRAYVQGEVMQGDNKYSCSGCNRHVEAVKRACLKDIPDHLIFHLKRFDFDIQTMTRCKINDEFAFPDRIDMAPYSIERLSDESADGPEDLFELVGVLVHSGTAETGHYYSLIRDQPATMTSRGSWLQFNDADVTVFDESRLRDHCFGGSDQHFPRVWSAYMLFYQRVTSLEKLSATYSQISSRDPVQLGLPLDLANHITLENEINVRLFCIQDPTHARFVRLLLERIQARADNTWSPNHEIETKTLQLALNYLNQVSSRFREQPEVDAYYGLLIDCVKNDKRCAAAILKCFEYQDSLFESLVLRNPIGAVRQASISLIHSCLRCLKENALVATSPSQMIGREEKRYRDHVSNIVQLAEDYYEKLPLFPRGWTDYFRLLSWIAKLGVQETFIILNHGFLYHCLTLIWIEIVEAPPAVEIDFPLLSRMMEKGKVFSYHGVVELFASLLDKAELQALDFERDQFGDRITITKDELALLLPTRLSRDRGRTPVLLWLSQCIGDHYHASATPRIIECLGNEDKWDQVVANTIGWGLASHPAPRATAFLRATLVFCNISTEEEQVLTLVRKALQAVHTIEDQAGVENLDFIKRLGELENVSINYRPGDFEDSIIRYAHFWSPPLLLYKEGLVRIEAVNMIDRLILSPLRREEEDSDDGQTKAICLEAVHRMGSTLLRAVNDTILQADNRARRNVLQGAQAVGVLQSMVDIVGEEGPDRWDRVVGESDLSLDDKLD